MTEFELNNLRIAADLYVSFYRAGHSFNASIDLAARQLADANSGTDFATQRELVREAVDALV
jgi:hypothetical protein